MRALDNSSSQVDTLLGILHVDPAQLASFLNDSNAAMKMINAVLRDDSLRYVERRCCRAAAARRR